MRKLKNVVFGVLIVVALAGFAARLLGIETPLTKPDITKKNNLVLSRVANDMNENLPAMIDEITRLDRVTGENLTLTYTYTLVGFSKEEISADALVSEIKPGMLSNYCTSPNMTELKDNHVKLQAKYLDESGQLITQFYVSSSECEG